MEQHYYEDASEIEKYLSKGVDCEVYPDYDNEDGSVVMVVVITGDWKHAHAFADYTMEKLGYTLKRKSVTESDGSDWYTAEHYYNT